VVTGGTDRQYEDIVILGAGGHGRQLRDIIEAEDRGRGSSRRVIGFLDDGKVDEELLGRRGDRLLGATSLVQDLDVGVAVGIADPAIRRRLGDASRAAGRSLVSAVHPSAAIGSLVVWGDGAMVSAGVFLDTNVRMGRLCHLNVHTSVGHDSILGDHVTVLPGARISGAVTIGDDVLIATNAVLFPGVHVGDRAVIAAGAVVHHDVPPDTTFLGLGKNRAG
jgi:sugar O-acyltransferase (sialic acid O-acetyltransferase NeuD family)